jgi:hypothetical protein
MDIKWSNLNPQEIISGLRGLGVRYSDAVDELLSNVCVNNESHVYMLKSASIDLSNIV